VSHLSTIVEPSPLPWFAVYVKSRHEKSVVLSLDGKGYESFLPTYPTIHNDGKKYQLPLFPGYVFCRFEPDKTLPVVSTPGVFSIVSCGSGPSCIPDSEIEGIRAMLRSGFTVLPWPYTPPGREICLKSGPLRGIQGVVVNDTHHKWVVVTLHLLQRSVAAKVDRAYLA
jgi:transcription antitermination factor NusG